MESFWTHWEGVLNVLGLHEKGVMRSDPDIESGPRAVGVQGEICFLDDKPKGFRATM